MQIRTKDGNHLHGSPDAIVRIMRDSHWTAGERCIEEYMDLVRQEVERIYGAEIKTDSPAEFLASLASHNLITIEEVA